MNSFDIDQLMTIMRSCAGQDEDVVIAGQIDNVDFDDLGYDSLALLETAARVSHTLGVELPEEPVGEARTPAAFVTLVNQQLAAKLGEGPRTVDPAAGAAVGAS